MKNKFNAMILTIFICLFVFGVAFGFVVLLGVDIKPLEGSGRTQAEATVIGSAFIAVILLGFLNGIRTIFNTYDWFVKELDKRDEQR